MKLPITVAVTLFSAANAQLYSYDVIVEMGSSFEPQYGNMYVLLKSSEHTKNISLTSEPQQILPYWNYLSAAQSPIAAPALVSAFFQWVSTRPSEGIRIARVSLVPKYMEEPDRSAFTKFFCAEGIVYCNDVVPLYPC